MNMRFWRGTTLLSICLMLLLGISLLPAQASVNVTPPSNLTAVVTPTSINLSWQNNSVNQTGLVVQCQKIDEYGDIVGNWSDHTWSCGLQDTYFSLPLDDIPWLYEKGLTMRFRVCAIIRDRDAGTIVNVYSNEVIVRLPVKILVYKIGQASYTLNGVMDRIDVAPVIIQGRTFLPIRYVVDPLGAIATWNGAENKVTIQTVGKTIELWINNNTARVNGVAVMIDPNNPNVMPVTVPPGRTMLPLRFIADNLGCQVLWDAKTSQIEIRG